MIHTDVLRSDTSCGLINLVSMGPTWVEGSEVRTNKCIGFVHLLSDAYFKDFRRLMDDVSLGSSHLALEVLKIIKAVAALTCNRLRLIELNVGSNRQNCCSSATANRFFTDGSRDFNP